MGPVERLARRPRHRDRGSPRTARRERAEPPPVGPCALRSAARNDRRAPGRDADDGVGQIDRRAVLHLDRSVGQQRRLGGGRARRVEAADVAPGDGVLVGRRVDEHAAAGARVEVGEERRDARRAGQQAADAAVRAGAVAFAKRDVAVGVDEGGPLVRRVERKGKGHVRAHAVVVCEGDPAADGGPERGVDLRGRRSRPAALRVKRMPMPFRSKVLGGNDEIAFVVEHGDVADVARRGRDGGPRVGDGARGAPPPADVSTAIRGRASGGRVERAALGDGDGTGGGSVGFERFQTRRGAGILARGREVTEMTPPPSPPHAVRVSRKQQRTERCSHLMSFICSRIFFASGSSRAVARRSGDELLEVGFRLRHLLRREVGPAAIVVERVLGRELRHQLAEQRERLVGLLLVDLADDDVHVRERILHLGDVQPRAAPSRPRRAGWPASGSRRRRAAGRRSRDRFRWPSSTARSPGAPGSRPCRSGRCTLDLGPEGGLGLRILVDQSTR